MEAQENPQQCGFSCASGKHSSILYNFSSKGQKFGEKRLFLLLKFQIDGFIIELRPLPENLYSGGGQVKRPRQQITKRPASAGRFA
jgi:hypothetical protein